MSSCTLALNFCVPFHASPLLFWSATIHVCVHVAVRPSLYLFTSWNACPCSTMHAWIYCHLTLAWKILTYSCCLALIGFVVAWIRFVAHMHLYTCILACIFDHHIDLSYLSPWIIFEFELHVLTCTPTSSTILYLHYLAEPCWTDLHHPCCIC